MRRIKNALKMKDDIEVVDWRDVICRQWLAGH
jgi:hypothetical protein